MDGKDKRRAVVILHPDFDLPGARGIKEAKEFAEQLLKGQQDMIAIAEQSENPEVIARMRKHIKAFRVLVRKLSEDSL